MFNGFHSIVTCHRDRRLSLRSFLESMLISSKLIDKNSFEIVITDMDDDSSSIINKYRDFLNIKHCRVKYDGIFCRGRALNHAVKNAEGDYITVLDIDSIISSHLFVKVGNFFSQRGVTGKKLCYRIRLMDMKNSSKFLFSSFGDVEINDIIRRSAEFKCNKERYTAKQIIFDGGNVPESMRMGEALGTSQFTMSRKDYVDIGGYDERFLGYGYEVMDFNRRAFDYQIKGYLFVEEEISVYHVINLSMPPNYVSQTNYENNRRIYEENWNSKVVKIPIYSGWGEF